MINPRGECSSRKTNHVTAVNVKPVYICVFTLSVSCEEDMAVIMSVFLQGTERPLNAFVEVSSYLSSLGTGVFQPKGHTPQNLLSSVKMWRVIVRRKSTILGSLNRL